MRRAKRSVKKARAKAWTACCSALDADGRTATPASAAATTKATSRSAPLKESSNLSAPRAKLGRVVLRKLGVEGVGEQVPELHVPEAQDVAVPQHRLALNGARGIEKGAVGGPDVRHRAPLLVGTPPQHRVAFGDGGVLDHQLAIWKPADRELVHAVERRKRGHHQIFEFKEQGHHLRRHLFRVSLPGA